MCVCVCVCVCVSVCVVREEQNIIFMYYFEVLPTHFVDHVKRGVFIVVGEVRYCVTEITLLVLLLLSLLL